MKSLFTDERSQMHTVEAAIAAMLMIAAFVFVTNSFPHTYYDSSMVQLQEYGEDTLQVLSVYPPVVIEEGPTWSDGDPTWVNISTTTNVTVGGGDAKLELTTTNLAIYPDDDSYVDDDRDTGSNYGSSTRITVGADDRLGTDNEWYAYLKFDLSSIPSGTTINDADFIINAYSETGSATISLKSVSDDTWDESTITGNNNPAMGATLDTDSQSTGWRTFSSNDLTNYIINEYGGDQIVSLGIGGATNGNNWIYYRSKEYNGDDPYLYVNHPIYKSSGNITSNPINYTEWAKWDEFYANDTTPAGTSITYSILYENDSFIMNVVSGQDISSITNSSIKLHAELSTTNSSITPTLHDWNVSWWKSPPPEPSRFSSHIEDLNWTGLDQEIGFFVPDKVTYNFYVVDSNGAILDDGNATVIHGLPSPEAVTVNKLIYVNPPNEPDYEVYEAQLVLWYE